MTNELQHPHEIYMQRALDLAILGTGNVSPNPMVGCVIVHNEKIIGEGWHRKYGEAHAEVNAVSSLQNKSLLKESVVYVTLEPCAHFGKTPPCADMLIREGAKEVVIASLDSNPLVGGKGVEKLRNAGVKVTIGVLEKEARQLNKRFFTFIEKKRPYIILKWAETSDGFIARENYDSKWISNELSRKLVHKWRSEEDAILVGMNTAKVDNPMLNVRDWSGRNPIRIVIDRSLTLNRSLNLFDKTQQTLCYNIVQSEKNENLEFVKIENSQFIEHMLDDLYLRKIQSVIIEGGAKTIQSFADANLWDEARIFISRNTFQRGIATGKISGKIASEQNIEGDILRIVLPVK